MRLCVPVTEDKGLDSPLCGHFGSAPLFALVTVETKECRLVPNGDAHHGHGMCRPLAALAGETVDAVAVGGIGMGALGKLNATGVRVFLATGGTAGTVAEDCAKGALPEATPATACGHHGHGPHGHGPHGSGPHGAGCGGGLGR